MLLLKTSGSIGRSPMGPHAVTGPEMIIIHFNLLLLLSQSVLTQPTAWFSAQLLYKKKPICFSGQNSSILKSRLTVHRSSPYRSSRFTLSLRLSLYLRRGEQQACRIARVRSMVGSMLVRSMGLRSCYLDPLHQPLYTALSL